MNNIEKAKQLLEGSHNIINVGPFQIQKRVIHILLTIGISIISYSAGKAISSTQLNPQQKEETTELHNQNNTTLPNLKKLSNNLTNFATKQNEMKEAEPTDLLAKIKKMGITEEDDVKSLSIKALSSGESFLAIAIRLEDPRKKVYFDGCGANIGLGYCIDVQVKNKGKSKVIQELVTAGVDKNDAAILTSDKVIKKHSRSAVKNISISNVSILALTKYLQTEYEEQAKLAVNGTGEVDYWSKLPKDIRDSLSWLHYNTGKLDGFKKLLTSVRAITTDLSDKEMKKHYKIISLQIAPFFRNPDDPAQFMENKRAAAFILTSFTPYGLSYAIHNPEIIESKQEDRTKILSFVNKEVKTNPQTYKEVYHKGNIYYSHNISNIDNQAISDLAKKGLVNIPNSNQVAMNIKNKSNNPIQENQQRHNQTIKH